MQDWLLLVVFWDTVGWVPVDGRCSDRSMERGFVWVVVKLEQRE